MGVYEAVKSRILQLCEEKKMTINKLAMEAGIPRSSLKNILYGKSQNPGSVTIKIICDGLGVSLITFFDSEVFRVLEQEIQ